MSTESPDTNATGSGSGAPAPPDDAVRVGAMLFTLVDPHVGHEVAYNRWYERDHFYAGCMVGPWLFAGRRWVATRDLKDLRFPADSTVATPVDRGSYLATYFIHAGHIAEHFDWANRQVFDLYANGRGFEERTHAHTALYTFAGSVSRDPDGVPVELALDHPYAGLVSVHIDRAEGVHHRDLAGWFEGRGRSPLLDPDSPIDQVAWWRPIVPDKSAPMDLGSGPGGPQRSLALLFLRDEPGVAWPRIEALATDLHDSGLGRVMLAAPFRPTIPGTDTYTDRLW